MIGYSLMLWPWLSTRETPEMTGATLFTEQWGSGPPVAFVHGLGASARYWQRVRDASTGYRGVAPDLLGFGRSPAPPDAAYDVDTHLDALAPVVPAGSLVVGHSTGGLLAAALAARRSDLVRRLLLIGLPAFPDERTARVEVGRLGLLARLTVTGSPLARLVCTAMCELRPLAIAVAPLVIRDLPPSIASDAARHTWPSYHRTLERVVAYRPHDDLATAPAAVTFLHGSDDRTAPPKYVCRLVDDLTAERKDIDLRLVPGDHHLAVRRPEQVAEIITKLVAAPEATR